MSRSCSLCGWPAQSSQVLALWSYSQSFINHNFGGDRLDQVLLEQLGAAPDERLLGTADDHVPSC